MSATYTLSERAFKYYHRQILNHAQTVDADRSVHYLLVLNGSMLNLAKARRIFAALWPPDRPDDISSLWFSALPGTAEAITGGAN